MTPPVPSITADDGSPWLAEGRGIDRVIATTDAQMEVWLADRLSVEASLAFNESITIDLSGALDGRALQVALDGLLARHDALRATLGPEGTELVIASAAPCALTHHDHRGLGIERAAEQVRAAQAAAVRLPFDLVQGPLVRVALHQVADDRHHLLMTAHHIVCDGWSWGVIVRDLADLYAEALGEAPSPPSAPSFAEFARWSAEEAASPAMREHEAWWLLLYEGSSIPVLDLPTDRPRPRTRSFESERLDRVLPATDLAQLRERARRDGVSLFAAAFELFALTLARITGQTDLVIGVPSAGQAASGLGSVVGHGVNLLPVRAAVDLERGFSEGQRATASRLLDAFDHATLTYGTLLRRLQVPRDPARLPLVAVMFNLDQALPVADLFSGLTARLSANPRAFENFELFVNLVPDEGGLRIETQFNAALFDAASIGRWLDVFTTLLRGAVREPDRPLATLDLLDEQARCELRALQPPADIADTGLAPSTMHAAFVRQARLAPARAALRLRAADGTEQHLSYGELDRQSAQLTVQLRARGIQRGARVGLCLPRSLDMVVALLAVLRSGAAYVPLDPDFPPARLLFYAEDAQLDLLITRSSMAQAPRAWRADAAERVLLLDPSPNNAGTATEQAAPGPDANVQPSDTAYVIYTSGSTGKPKGVCVPHGAVANFLASMQQAPGIRPDDRLAAVTTLSFDIAVLEILLPLSVGAETILVSRDTVLDGAALAALLDDTGTTLMQATPGLWRMLLEAGWRGAPGFVALAGGESVPVDLAEALLDRCAAVWNLYGPTETTVWSTAWQIDRRVLRERGMSIGRPIASTQVWVLNDRLQPVPVGVPGEVCIGGAGVTLGYLDRPDLTAERFVADPFSDRPGARLYRTGDRGRWRNDGLIEHLGRMDFQVKVRGYRIELGEIEAACLAADGVGDAVVLAREDQPGDTRLVAYLVGAAGLSLNTPAVLQSLERSLPSYMLPQHLELLDALPRLPNGKVDRKALPAPRAGHLAAASAGRRAPRNERERAVLAAMEKVLSLPGLGIDDDFFALGGHSLLAARLATQLGALFDQRVPLRSVFEARTAGGLAQRIETAAHSAQPRTVRIRHDPDLREAPLTPMQARIVGMEALLADRALYNTPSAHRLRGPLDATALHDALRDLVARQSSLRTSFGPSADGPATVQHIHASVDVDLPVIDLQAVDPVHREAELMRRLQAAADAPIDITRAPLLRTALYVLGPEHHVLLFTPHHLVWDGWSFDLLYDELASLYPARLGQPSPRLPMPSVTYGDWARWLSDWMQGDECEAQIAFWRHRFAQAPEGRQLLTDRPRRPGMTGSGATEWIHIDSSRAERLREIARGADATLSTLLMTAFAALLAEVCGHPHVVVGLPVRGRNHAELESITGFFNNLVPVHVSLPARGGVQDLLATLQCSVLEVFNHQDVPFERLAAEPEVLARTHRLGLYQALFSFQDARERPRTWGPLAQSNVLLHQQGATQDLGLWLMEVPGGLEGGITYNADLYLSSTAQALKARFVELLDRWLAAPGQAVSDWLERGTSAPSAALAHLARHGMASPRAAAEPTPSRGEVAAAAIVTEPSPASVPAPSPASNTEAALAALWSELLGVPAHQILAHDNFFDLGGHSLLALNAAASIEKRFGVAFNARRLVFESLGQIAATLSQDADRAASGTPVASAAAAGRPRDPVSPAAPAPVKPAEGLVGRLFGRWKTR